MLGTSPNETFSCRVYLTTELFFCCFPEYLLELEYGEQALRENTDLTNSSILLPTYSPWNTAIDKNSLLHHGELSVLQPVITNYLHFKISSLCLCPYLCLRLCLSLCACVCVHSETLWRTGNTLPLVLHAYLFPFILIPFSPQQTTIPLSLPCIFFGTRSCKLCICVYYP